MADISRNSDGSKDSSGGPTARERAKRDRQYELLDFMQDKELDCGDIEFDIYQILTITAVRPSMDPQWWSAFVQTVDNNIIEITVDEMYEILTVLYWHQARKHYELSRSYDYQEYYPQPIGPYRLDGLSAYIWIFHKQIREDETEDIAIKNRRGRYVSLQSEWEYLFFKKREELINNPEYLEG